MTENLLIPKQGRVREVGRGAQSLAGGVYLLLGINDKIQGFIWGRIREGPDGESSRFWMGTGFDLPGLAKRAAG